MIFASTTPIVGGPAAGLPAAVEMDPAQYLAGLPPGGSVPAGYLNWILREITTGIAGRYGDASDTNVSLSSGTTTLLRPMYYDHLNLSGTAVLAMNGFPVYCRQLTISGSARMHNDGNDGEDASGAAGASGTGGASNVLGGGGAGATGAEDAVGNPGTGLTNALGGAGGAGQGISAPLRAGGAAGSAAAPAASDGPYLTTDAAHGHILGGGAITRLLGGGGGGTGASGANANYSGGGGGGGGTGVVWAMRFNRSGGRISCNGGDAGAGESIGPAVGGSGGGGGGLLYIVTLFNYGSSTTIECLGGAGSAGLGGASAGAAGAAGRVIELRAA